MNITVPKLCIIAGYYGVGKTNLSLNLALSAAAQNKMISAHGTRNTLLDTGGSPAEKITLIDLDVINPYFRSSDYVDKLADEQIKVIIPAFARTGIETPALSAAINGALASKDTVIIDVGGDDAGATTLARYSRDIERRLSRAETAEHALYYVVNRNRSTAVDLDAAASEALWQLREIERACKMDVTGIVNNTHLQDETNFETVIEGLSFARKLAEDADLPLVATTIPAFLVPAAEEHPLLAEMLSSGQIQAVRQLVTTPWQ